MISSHVTHRYLRITLLPLVGGKFLEAAIRFNNSTLSCKQQLFKGHVETQHSQKGGKDQACQNCLPKFAHVSWSNAHYSRQLMFEQTRYTFSFLRSLVG